MFMLSMYCLIRALSVVRVAMGSISATILSRMMVIALGLIFARVGSSNIASKSASEKKLLYVEFKSLWMFG